MSPSGNLTIQPCCIGLSQRFERRAQLRREGRGCSQAAKSALRQDTPS